MQNITAGDTLSLQPCQIVSLKLEQKQTIRVVYGRVWITIEADMTDYWLAAGESLVLPRHKHIVIEAASELGSIDGLTDWLKPAVLERRAGDRQSLNTF